MSTRRAGVSRRIETDKALVMATLKKPDDETRQRADMRAIVKMAMGATWDAPQYLLELLWDAGRWTSA
jgi:hypothetical protein